jgi:hypothetical protein
LPDLKEGEMKRGRLRERWTDEVEENLKIMGKKNLHIIARDL